jgi:biopolymer transport protein TolQ
VLRAQRVKVNEPKFSHIRSRKVASRARRALPPAKSSPALGNGPGDRLPFNAEAGGQRLLLASIWSWAIILEKLFLYAKTRKETDKFEQVFWSGQSLEELYNALSQRRNTGMAALFVAAMREWKRSTERESGDKSGRPMPGVQLRVEKVMDVTISREVERLERRLTFLATVGSTAPFIGLFGTVWGIMTSFQAIAVSKNTSLAVVAPGIAEALFATALGLLAAIPAVIFYNKFNSEVARHAAGLEGFADEFASILSRQIDKTA